MSTKRLPRLMAAVAASALVLAACSGDPDPTSPTPAPGETSAGVDQGELQDKMVGAMPDFKLGDTFKATEPVSFSLLYRDHPNYPVKDDWLFFEELEKNQNVTFERVNVPLSDWNDRRALLIAAGDAPEMIPSTYIADAEQYTAGGALLPIGDYLEYLPNFQDKIDKWGLQSDLEELAYQGDGKLYVLPGLHEVPKPQYSIVVRDDLWQAAGITEDPATWDEFKEQLQIVKDANPDLTYPYTERWSLNGPLEATMSAAAPNFGTSAGWGYGQGVTYDEDEQKYVYTGATDEYKSLVEYFASLVADGLLDPESVSQDDDTALAKFTSGQAAAIGGNDQEIVNYRRTMEEAGMTDAVLRLIVVPEGPAGSYLPAGGQFESGIAFSSEAAEQEDFVAMLQFVDWLYFSDEGLEFSKWGVEGVTYEKGEDGTRTLAEDIDINALNPGAPKLLNADYGFHNGVFMPAHGSTSDLVQSMLRDEVKEWLTKMNEKDILPVPPAIRLDEIQKEQASLLATPLQDRTNQNTAAFILGQRSLDEWDQHVAELEASNMQQYVDLMNEATAN